MEKQTWLIFQHGKQAGIDTILEQLAPGPGPGPEQFALASLRGPWLGIVLDSVGDICLVAYASDSERMLLQRPVAVATVVAAVAVAAVAGSVVEGRDWDN